MLLPHHRRVLTLLFLTLVPSALGGQAPGQVTGHVRSGETTQPMAGVQIVVKGTNIGTLTNDAGNFALQVPRDATTLVFTSLGYQTVEAPIQPRLEIALHQQAIGIEGLVVTALGLRREKRSLGYSVQDLKSRDVARAPDFNFVNDLQGKVAGVHITNAGPTGGTARIVVRGSSSLTGSNQPLFVVDGIPVDNRAQGDGDPRNYGYGGLDYGNAIQDLDPNNIRSISILKGPNAAALYGSRAANGAVVITTKSGRDIDAAGTGLTATSSITFETPLRLPSYQDGYGQGSRGQFQWVDGGADPQGGGIYDYIDESWGPRMDGRPIDQFTGAAMPWSPHPDNVRSFFNTGSTWSTNVAVGRTNTSSDLRLSFTNVQLSGMAPGERINRKSIALKGGASLTTRLTADASLNYVTLGAKNRMGTGYEAQNAMQGFTWFGRQVDLNALRHYLCDGTEPTPCDANGGQYNWNYLSGQNPFWAQLVDTNGDERDRVMGSGQVSYQLDDWITLTGRVGRDWYREHRKDVGAIGSQRYAGQGGFTEMSRYVSETNADVLATATRQLSSKVSLNVNAGGNVRTNDYTASGVSVTGLIVPDIYSVDNAGVTPAPWDNVAHKKVRSLYASASLSYGGYLNLDVTGRNDWSSTLPAESWSYFYPSVSSAFVFTDALGLESAILSSGKVRASWTRVGSDTDPYQLTSSLDTDVDFGSAPLFSVSNVLPAIHLKPERTTAWEVGTDLGFLDERLGFVLTYYSNTTRDQILPVQISATSGYGSRILNAGEVRNRGWELLLNATPIRHEQGFRWDMTVNWSRNDSKVVDLHGDLQTLVLGAYWSVNIEARKNEPYGVMIGNGYLRCGDAQIAGGACTEDQRGMLMLDASGVPRTDPTRRILGNYNPDWIGGIRNRFSYGPFELSVLVDGQKGGNILSMTRMSGQSSGVLASTLRGRENDWNDPGIVERGVLPDGSVNGDGANDVSVTAEDYFRGLSDNRESAILDASYVKLREVRLGYTLPPALMRRLGFSGGDISLIGRNLALWSRAENIDPETAFDASNVQGIECGQMPTARSIGFALSIRP
ncbi:MAG: SusC/RagA family TonB-linked outer membrane protein [Gemmatimonadetes bacterium]|nr:SusC/RagA family TonB-linked outer membrane protein [Gemmatimonadota bacterium]